MKKDFKIPPYLIGYGLALLVAILSSCSEKQADYQVELNPDYTVTVTSDYDKVVTLESLDDLEEFIWNENI